VHQPPVCGGRGAEAGLDGDPGKIVAFIRGRAVAGSGKCGKLFRGRARDDPRPAPKLAEPKPGQQDLRRPYGYNYTYLGTGDKKVTMSQIPNPSATVRIAEYWRFDANVGSIFAYPPERTDTKSYCYPPGFHSGNVGGGNTPAARLERLKGMNNMLWLDSHVSSMTGNRIVYPKGINAGESNMWFDPKAPKL
jgi:prepilin-type processing-associated H-X9-DG protein